MSTVPGKTRPVETESEAQAVAEAFLREHWPEFGRRKWSQDHPYNSHWEDDCEIRWTQVLNEHGTRASYDLQVSVEMTTGRVLSCYIPPDRVNGPVAPRVTLAQARHIATPHAYRDPAVVPFSPCYPQIQHDTYGVAGLSWHLQQVYQGEDADGDPETCALSVNALTGQEAYSLNRIPRDHFAQWRLASWEAAQRTQELLQLPPLPMVTLRGGAGELYTYEKPLVRDGETWLRVELLRGFGVRVFGDARRPMLRLGKRRMTAEACGAQFHGYGWWVPLNRAAHAFSWKVRWNAVERAVEVQHAPAKPFGAGGSGDPLAL